MKLEGFFTLWGWPGSAADAVHFAHKAGFDGVEGQVPSTVAQREAFAKALELTGLSYIQEIATTGTYVPDRSLSLQDHLTHFEQQLNAVSDNTNTNTNSLNGYQLNPKFVTCLGGCDAWSVTQSLEFFSRAQALAQAKNITVCFETHRGRILYNPWRCLELCEALPSLRLTFDISHWCVVCEGLQDTEINLIRSLASRTQHIHARVGYDQGPQVPQPFNGVYKKDLDLHLSIWRELWDVRLKSGQTTTTFTPEFGVDGYEYRSLDGSEPRVNPTQLNIQMLQLLRSSF